MKSRTKTAEKKYILIREAIRSDILKGLVQNQLPGERVLAKQYGASYMTIRRAVEMLVDEGLVYRVPDSGTFINRDGILPRRTGNIGYLLLKEHSIEDQDSAAYYFAENDGEGIDCPYYSKIFRQFESASKKKKFSLIYYSSLEDIYPFTSPRKIDGLIVSYFPSMEDKINKISSLLPIVLIDNSFDQKDIPSVLIDNEAGIFKAVEYLIQQGHRDIGFLSGGTEIQVGSEKYCGYKRALQKYEITERHEFVYTGDFHFNTGYKSAEYFLSLDPKPTAIACANDSMAMGLVKGFFEKGVKIPEDISITGFDDIDIAKRIFPSLTTIRVDYESIAERCMELLIRQINDGCFEAKPLRIATELVVRDSVLPVKKHIVLE